MSRNLANEIYQAIVKHTAWKKRLHNVIETGKKDDKVSAEHSELGQWLKANASELSSHKHYVKVLELHEQLYKEAQRIVILAQRGSVEDARTAIEYGSAFERLSQELVHNIIVWHDAVIGKKVQNIIDN